MLHKNQNIQENIKDKMSILIAGPRGFCAGVDRAIKIVERALEKFGAPVYVRHEIVHNKFVVNSLRDQGAIFVKELDEVPDDKPVVFSAHGVAKSVPAEAERRNMLYVDATCPLVSKVHRGAERFYNLGYKMILIGHKGHPEVIGTMGQLPEGVVVLVEDVADVEALELDWDESQLAYITQTTLSLDDTKDVIEALVAKYPQIKGPKSQDICYATTNRQQAVKAMAANCDAMLVVGAPNSSNSMRLTEVALTAGCPKSMLVERAADIDWEWLKGVKNLGLTAGASAPEVLVQEIIDACREKYDVTVEDVAIKKESITFRLPQILDDTPEAA